jgi:hypothetical protein
MWITKIKKYFVFLKGGCIFVKQLGNKKPKKFLKKSLKKVLQIFGF